MLMMCDWLRQRLKVQGSQFRSNAVAMPAKRHASTTLEQALAKRFCLARPPKQTEPGKRQRDPSSTPRLPAEKKPKRPDRSGGADDAEPVAELRVGLAEETAEQHLASHGGKCLPKTCARCRRLALAELASGWSNNSC